jgi:hypothetical protein
MKVKYLFLFSVIILPLNITSYIAELFNYHISFHLTEKDNTPIKPVASIPNFPSSPNPLILGVLPVALKSVQLLPPTFLFSVIILPLNITSYIAELFNYHISFHLTEKDNLILSFWLGSIIISFFILLFKLLQHAYPKSKLHFFLLFFLSVLI